MLALFIIFASANAYGHSVGLGYLARAGIAGLALGVVVGFHDVMDR